MNRIASLVLALTLTGTALAIAEEPQPRYQRRWVWVMSNLLVDAEADRVAALVERAGRAGYNGLVLADFKFNLLAEMPTRYFANVERIKTAASRAGVEIIPTLFPIGYSDGLLRHDPNLAEGLPVEAAPFVVEGREAHFVPSPQSAIRNAGLEETQGDTFAGISFQDAPGKITFTDRKTVHGGQVACRMENFQGGNSRLFRHVAVRPHAVYRFSAWVKTEDLNPPGNFHLTANSARGPLTFQEGEIETTQDWKPVQVVFNSLDQTEVDLLAGLWNAHSGKLWLDDFTFEELGPINLLRRPGCPFTITSEDGQTTYPEGVDHEPVIDPKLGQVPYAGQYEFNHPAPPIRLTPQSRIKTGDHLRVSWYHPILIHGQQIMCCLSEPKVFELLNDQARRVETLFHPKTVFLGIDEVRVANWCIACQNRKLTPGALLADATRRCLEILHQTSPQAQVVAWSDMFDPNHNALPKYDLVNGSLEGSWNGLPPSVIVANWNSGKAKASLEFFARQGHEQILAGYYDGDDNFPTWNQAARGVPKVVGFMYTTWQAHYDDLERYGKLLTAKP